MPTAILIGFEYTVNSLIGAIVDLYQAYKWCSSFNYIIHVLTDIEKVKDSDFLQQVIDRKFAEPDIMTFYQTLKSKTIISDHNDLINSLTRILSKGIPDNKLIIYYSGHGVKDSMVMTNRTLLSFISFRNEILAILNSYVEIFWILDCCNPNGLYLPYRLDGNRFRLSSSKIECVSQPILLITSSEETEKSVATKYGSIFSRHLFRLLSSLNRDNIPISTTIPLHKNRNLRRLIGNLSSVIRKMHTGYAQTVSIYSSYMIDPVLWLWISSARNYDIVADPTLTVLIIRDNSESETPYFNPYDLVYPE